ncbi:MAG: hypothetical protein JWO67_3202 [Streptosporangiaceae bacterium]|nr:hypothetical protein [Streptosporangiaceae bacterium]
MLRELRERRVAEDDFEEFVGMLLDALEIPEVQQAVREALGPAPAPQSPPQVARAPIPPPAVPARGAARRRGART